MHKVRKTRVKISVVVTGAEKLGEHHIGTDPCLDQIPKDDSKYAL